MVMMMALAVQQKAKKILNNHNEEVVTGVPAGSNLSSSGPALARQVLALILLYLNPKGHKILERTSVNSN